MHYCKSKEIEKEKSRKVVKWIKLKRCAENLFVQIAHLKGKKFNRRAHSPFTFHTVTTYTKENEQPRYEVDEPSFAT